MTADEQSDAAYADLINTSMDQRGIDELSEGKLTTFQKCLDGLKEFSLFQPKKNYFIFIHIEELELLDRGGQMWESGSTEKENKKGLVGDLFNVFKAFSGGAHITKNKYGET